MLRDKIHKKTKTEMAAAEAGVDVRDIDQVRRSNEFQKIWRLNTSKARSLKMNSDSRATFAIACGSRKM